jgi:hypothetical protein
MQNKQLNIPNKYHNSKLGKQSGTNWKSGIKNRRQSRGIRPNRKRSWMNTKKIQMEHAWYLGHHKMTKPMNHGCRRMRGYTKLRALTTYLTE